MTPGESVQEHQWCLVVETNDASWVEGPYGDAQAMSRRTGLWQNSETVTTIRLMRHREVS